MGKQPLTYEAAGVDYRRVDALKVLAQQAARATAHNAAGQGMSEFGESRGESAYVFEVGGRILASITERLGTKSLGADARRAITAAAAMLDPDAAPKPAQAQLVATARPPGHPPNQA